MQENSRDFEITPAPKRGNKTQGGGVEWKEVHQEPWTEDDIKDLRHDLQEDFEKFGYSADFAAKRVRQWIEGILAADREHADDVLVPVRRMRKLGA